MNSKKSALAAVAAALLSLPAFAAPVVFTGVLGGLGAAVSFDISGSNLLVTLTNTGTADPIAPGNILTGVIFSLPGNLLLTRVSAAICPTCSVKGNGGLTDPGGVVGGEWAYTNALAGSFIGQQSIYSSGYFSGVGFLFAGTNLQGPASVDGVQYGITTLNDGTGNDNGGLTGEGLIVNATNFVLSGLPNGFSLGSIGGVSFQYGTGLDEPNIIGTSSSGTGNSSGNIPEPGSTGLALLGLALLGGALGVRAKREKTAAPA